jgi:hypothetical protein
MTRPRKDVVDYFPHYIARGKTIPILEKKYGNDGYAFWWKILEILGMSEGHYFDCNNPSNWEYLTAYTLVSEDIATEIIDLLAKLDAIDKSFWSKKIIWTGNFIENLIPLYARRKQKPPTREDIVNIITESNKLLYTETLVTGIIDDINPQSKVEYSKVEKSRVLKDLSIEPPIDSNNGFSLNELAAIWNSNRPPILSAVKIPFSRSDKGTMNKFMAVLKKNPDRQWWEAVIAKIHQSSFMQGKNDRGWKATLDYVIEKAEKIYDGHLIDQGADKTTQTALTAYSWAKNKENQL